MGVLTAPDPRATQAAHSDPFPLSASERSTILPHKESRPQFHKLYDDDELLFS